MKRTPLKRGKEIARGGRIKPKQRSASEFQRIYGGKARVAWVKAQPCLICKSVPSENAHVVGSGASRKADADAIVPLCAHHHRLSHNKGWSALGPLWPAREWRLAVAATIDIRWMMSNAESE